MYLQKLQLQGFKSFAEKVVLEFPRPGKGCPLIRNDKPQKDQLNQSQCGIAAIVGPNGAGKSNVADAVLWALGEQSLKTLRSKKSEDVIFSGSAKKARLGLAEVSLFINNEDKTMPVDFPEVIITRRLYRNGESEYLINKRKVRLQDVLMLVAKSNFGQKSYSVIGQGMIDSILSASPAERKDFFDEAVGVRQYQIKREQSLNKLENTWENLKQAEVLLQEIGPRLRSLTRQVRRLERRELVEKELKELQKNYYGALWQELEKDLVELKPKFEKLQKKTKTKQAELKEVQEKLAELEKQDTRTETFNKLQQNYQKILSQKNDLSEKQLILKHKIELAKQKTTKAEIMPVIEIIDRLKEIEKAQNKLLNLIESKNFESIKKEAERLTEEIKELITELEGPSIKEGKIDQKLEQELEEVFKKIKAVETDLTSAQKEIDDFNKKQDQQKGEFFELQRKFQEQQSTLNKLNSQSSEIRVELTRLETKKENLETEIKEEMQDFSWLKEFQVKTNLDQEESLDKIRKLKRQIELIGGIDPEAVKEYEETKERYDFLKNQSEDLKKSIKSLEEVIKDLDETIQQQFNSSFKNINKEFQKFFKILFQGGKAELNLIKEEVKKEEKKEVAEIAEGTAGETEDTEPFDSAPLGLSSGRRQGEEEKPWLKIKSERVIKGIDIFACPPGKKLKGINVLSGGERALTSIALVCAIISNNPSPFVVLDEVDAALDEANSLRFAQILDELAHKTQFITITHNRATMHKSNILYGVTMGDDGVSKLLSMRLEEAEKYER